MTIIGTRPEAIKLAPVLAALENNHHFESEVCITWQHTHLLAPFLKLLNIPTTYTLDLDPHLPSLCLKAAHILEKLAPVLERSKPDLVIVQGDTTTAFMAALAAFYSRIPVAHIEAGLRTGSLTSPWPEEAHRLLIDRLTNLFFAPTETAREQLLQEGIPPDHIWIVGNTSIDALRLLRTPSSPLLERTILVTVHRRENQGGNLEEICRALRKLAEKFLDVKIVFFLHPNPGIREPALRWLSETPRIELKDPVDHFSFVKFMDQALFIITDSGGVQEEAPFLGKPVVIIRDTTERPEGVWAGTARLVGTEEDKIVACCEELLENPETLAAMSRVHFPYGDGYAAERIVNVLEKELCETSYDPLFC